MGMVNAIGGGSSPGIGVMPIPTGSGGTTGVPIHLHGGRDLAELLLLKRIFTNLALAILEEERKVAEEGKDPSLAFDHIRAKVEIARLDLNGL